MGIAIMQSTTQISASTTILITLVLVIALFPSLFHYAWTAPFSLIPLFGSSHSPVTDTEPRQGTATMWTQKQFTLQPKSRGSYLITDQVLQALPEIKNYKVGLLNLFVQHTSCALSLNENFDTDVREDMPAHIKSALVGASVTIPIKDGKLATGTWQGIWYLEFRAVRHSRRVMATIQGEKA